MPWPCPISPPAHSLTGVPVPEPLSRTQLEPSVPVKPGTAHRRHLHLGPGFPRLCFSRSQKGLPWLCVCPTSSLGTLPLPSFLQPPQARASTRQQPQPWHCSPPAPKSSSLHAGEVPLRAASSAPPPPQCPWQRHTGDRKDNSGTWSLGNAAQRGDLSPAGRSCSVTFG